MPEAAQIERPYSRFDVAPVPLRTTPRLELVATAALQIGERIGFQIPARIWGAMFACYGLFFAAIIAATGGGGHARFAIVIAVLYTVMYFGLAQKIAGLVGQQPPSPLDGPRAELPTCYGPMSEFAVATQILIVPIALVIFAVGFLIVRMAVMP